MYEVEYYATYKHDMIHITWSDCPMVSSNGTVLWLDYECTTGIPMQNVIKVTECE